MQKAKELIENYMKENKIGKIRFCKKCKISPETLNKILNGGNPFGLLPLFRIAEGMEIRMSELFDE